MGRLDEGAYTHGEQNRETWDFHEASRDRKLRASPAARTPENVQMGCRVDRQMGLYSLRAWVYHLERLITNGALKLSAEQELDAERRHRDHR